MLSNLRGCIAQQSDHVRYGRLGVEFVRARVRILRLAVPHRFWASQTQTRDLTTAGKLGVLMKQLYDLGITELLLIVNDCSILVRNREIV